MTAMDTAAIAARVHRHRMLPLRRVAGAGGRCSMCGDHRATFPALRRAFPEGA